MLWVVSFLLIIIYSLYIIVNLFVGFVFIFLLIDALFLIKLENKKKKNNLKVIK